MTYGTVLGVLFIHLGFILSTLAYWLAARAICPGLVDWSEQRHAERPVRSLIVGMLIGIPVFALGVLLAQNPILPGLKLVGSIMVLGLLLMGLLGSAGLAQRVGRNLRHGPPESPWRTVARGGVVVLLLLIFPVLGWFIMIPVVLVSGLGSSLSYLRSRRRAAGTLIPSTEPAA